jgi:choline dehydrogenase-like flavoprotein
MPAPAAKGHPIAQAGLQAAAQAGHPIVADISAGAEQGFGWCDLNIIDGRRQSAADAYLNPVLGRPNLDVVTDALAHRVTITDGHRTGVEYSAGTCALGTDGMAVVDTDLRVHGIESLRVAGGIRDALTRIRPYQRNRLCHRRTGSESDPRVTPAHRCSRRHAH